MDTILSPSDYYHGVYRNRTIVVQGNPALLTQQIHEQIHSLTQEGLRFLMLSEPGTQVPEIGTMLRTIAAAIADDIAEVMLLTQERGILCNNRRVPVIFSRDIADDGTHATVPIALAQRRIVRQIRDLLPTVGKIVMTADIRREIESVFGSGTMFVESTQLRRSPLQALDEPVFDAAYGGNASKGTFRARNRDELRELKDHHSVVKIRESLLGGYSLLPRSGGWAELAALWAGHLGNGMGTVLAEHFREEFSGSQSEGMYALSTPHADDPHDEDRIVRRFTRYGLHHAGTLAQLQQDNAKALPPDLLAYDTQKTGRNPLLFMLRKSR